MGSYLVALMTSGEGTLIACDRVAADRPYYSAKHRCHGKNVQVIAGPDGTIPSNTPIAITL